MINYLGKKLLSLFESSNMGVRTMLITTQCWQDDTKDSYKVEHEPGVHTGTALINPKYFVPLNLLEVEMRRKINVVH